MALGALPRLLRRRAAGKATPSTCATTTGRRRPTRRKLSFETYTEDVVAALERLGPTTVVVGHGMGGLLALKAAERMPIGGLVLLSPELPRELRPPARPHELREIPDVYGRSLIGWETLPGALLRDHRDLTLADVLRIQHLLGQKPHESGAARRQMLAGVSVDRRGVRRPSRGWSSAPASTGPSRLDDASGSPSGSAPSTSRSAPIRTTAWSSARTATSRSPRRSGRSSRPTGCSGRAGRRLDRRRRLVSSRPAGRRRPGRAAFV